MTLLRLQKERERRKKKKKKGQHKTKKMMETMRSVKHFRTKQSPYRGGGSKLEPCASPHAAVRDYPNSPTVYMLPSKLAHSSQG